MSHVPTMQVGLDRLDDDGAGGRVDAGEADVLAADDFEAARYDESPI